MLKDQKKKLISEQEKFDSTLQMTQLVDTAINYLFDSDLDGFGRTLDENWILKRSLSDRISNEVIDEIYSTAKKNGALGGKILGAGGGGFLLFYCRKENQNKLRKALKGLREVDYKFDKVGTKIIYNEK